MLRMVMPRPLLVGGIMVGQDPIRIHPLKQLSHAPRIPVLSCFSLLVCRANAQQPKLFVPMILILIFAEALGLYGLIVGIILSSRAGQSRAD